MTSLAVTIMGLLSAHAGTAQTVINYPGGFAGSSQIFLANAAAHYGDGIRLTSTGVHAGNNAWFKVPVSVQAFTTTFTFKETCPTGSAMCGDGLGFEMIGTPNSSSAGFNFTGFSGGQFSWSQCNTPYSTPGSGCVPINGVLVKFDLYNNQTGSSRANLTGLYSGGEYPQAPANPQYDMSSSGIYMQSGDLMSCTLTYNGTVLTETLTDTVTGARYTGSYTVNIPSLVAGDTAYVGFGGGTGAATVTQDLESWTYTIDAAGQAAPPAFSPAGGTYTASPSVKLASASSGTVICYSTSGRPVPNGSNGCASGTLYTGPVTVASTETLYAVAGGSGYGNSSAASASYRIAAPTLYPAAAPTFSPAGGTFSDAQSVRLSSASGPVICYNTTGSPATDGASGCAAGSLYTGPVTVSSSETLYAVAGGSGYDNSPVSTASFVIQAPSVSQAVIDYSGGFPAGCCGGGSDPIWLQNATVMAGSAIRLTSLGAHAGNNAWFKTPVNVDAFTTTFTFDMNCGGNVGTCANGMGFMMLAANSAGNPVYRPPSHPGFTFSGYSGNQFSWSQCSFTPYRCVAIQSILVKFDIFDNTTLTTGASLTGLCSGGGYCEPPYNTQYDMAPSGVILTSGHRFRCTLSYDGTTLTEIVTDTVTNATYTNRYTVNIPSLVGGDTAFVGFGGGTGDTFNVTQDVDSWTYNVQ